jgi:hypothetical protein
MLLPPSNSTSDSASELHISIYAHSETALDFASPGLEYILETLNFRTRASRRAKMPAAFAIAARQLHALRRHYTGKLKLIDVREMFLQMRDRA